jgi:integrase
MTEIRHHDRGLHWDPARQRYETKVDLGFGSNGDRIRRTVRGRTKEDVRDKVRKLLGDVNSGIRTPASYTVQQCVQDWLDDLTLDSDTLSQYRGQASKWIYPHAIGSMRLADEFRVKEADAFFTSIAPELSQRSLVMIKSTLRRAIRRAQAKDYVSRNVMDLVDLPKAGKRGRPSRAMSQQEAKQFLEANKDDRLYAAWVLAMTHGLRPGELRALRWEHVDLDAGVLRIWRSSSRSGGTKGEEQGGQGSRRTLKLARVAATALRGHQERQEKERADLGTLWQEHGLVFCHEDGHQFKRDDYGYRFEKAAERAGLGHWHPHEGRHTYASVASERGVPHQLLADSMGHKNKTTFETVYRHVIAPEIQAGTDVMDDVFG